MNTEQTIWTRAKRRYDDWYAMQSRTRLTVFATGYILSVFLFGWIAYMLAHPPHKLVLSDAVAFGICEFSFWVFWPGVTLKWKSITWNFRRTNRRNIVGVLLVTAWLCLFFGLAHQARANEVAGQQASISQSANPDIIVPQCNFWAAMLILFIGALFFGFLLYLLCKLGFCGNKGNKPPQSPPGSGDGGNALPRTATPQTTVPQTTFWFSGGIMVSNSAGLPLKSLPPFLSIDGQPVPNGSQISSLLTGFTTPPSIAVWNETNVVSDTNLDVTHPYVAIYNFTVLTSTNVLGSWKELCTVVGWMNNNPTTPLATTIVYTNGVPVTTNWIKCHLNASMQPTNVVVWGALPSLNNNVVYLPHAVPHDGPPAPGGGGGTGTNGVSNIAFPQFYKLTCNTNDIKTSWP